jgi:hypothetical protein
MTDAFAKVRNKSSHAAISAGDWPGKFGAFKSGGETVVAISV